jgi:hypothetical protein
MVYIIVQAVNELRILSSFTVTDTEETTTAKDAEDHIR